MKKQKFYAYSVEGKTNITTDRLSCEKIISAFLTQNSRAFLRKTKS
ncbi:MAG: hypothetical protein QMD06_02320 [Candidatus Altarchaeum sp.]|nr:hypothetical protein [Candidatus Altarchaeum sp.]